MGTEYVSSFVVKLGSALSVLVKAIALALHYGILFRKCTK
jgi:hypothetical protein